jgi:MarR family transcriptional regulator, organic hydroperoxide resistance regulator
MATSPSKPKKQESPKRRILDLGSYAPEETIAFLLWDTTRTFHRTFQKLLASHGLNFGLWPFLRALWTEDGIGVRELGKRVHMSAPTTSSAVKALEKARLVYRDRDANDSRKTLVYLTEEGKQLFSTVLPAMQYVNERAASGVSLNEQDFLKTVLKKMRKNMREQQEEY